MAIEARAVQQRLDQLRVLAVLESDSQARARLAAERPPPPPLTAAVVAARLHELRALCELTAHLHRARPAPGR